MRAKWGQNFLRDKKILQKIVDFARVSPTDMVVEVGPGEGTLTELLLERAGKVIAVEKDVELVNKLKERFEDLKKERLEVVNEDILNYELRIKNYALVGNIPYYITGEIFRKFLQGDNPPQSITFVVQKEVADRIMARNKKESVLSISIKTYGTPEYGGIIRAGGFSPRPKVDSAIISIRSIGKKRFEDEKIKEEEFFKTLKRGFSHKRKLLIKNLGMSKDVFDRSGISEKARAEDLSVEDWICLTKESV